MINIHLLLQKKNKIIINSETFTSVDLNLTTTEEFGNETTATTSTTPTTRATTLSIYNSMYPWTNVHNFKQCSPAFNFLKGISYQLERTLRGVEGSASILNRYHQTIAELYSNTSIDVNALVEHGGCSDALDEGVEVLDVYQMIAGLAVNMTTSDSLVEAYSYAIQIPPLFKMAEISFTDEKVKAIDRNVYQKCDWLSKRATDVRAEYQRMDGEFEELAQLTSNTGRLFKIMTVLFNDLNKKIRHKITIFTGKGQKYLDEKITKSKLSQEFASTHFLIYRENVADLRINLQQLIKEYNKELNLGMEKLKDIYKKVFGFNLPVINNHNVYQLNIVRNSTQINDTTLQGITNGLHNNLEEKMAALITETYARLEQPFIEMKTNLLDPIGDMLEQINDLDEVLTEYIMSTKMNTHFFM